MPISAEDAAAPGFQRPRVTFFVFCDWYCGAAGVFRDGGPEDLTVAFLEMKAEIVLVGEQGIEGMVDPVIVYLVAGNAEEIIEGGLFVP